MPDDYGNKPFVTLGEAATGDNLLLSQVEDVLDGMAFGMHAVDAEGNDLGQIYESDLAKITLQPYLETLSSADFGKLATPKSIAAASLAKQLRSVKKTSKSRNLKQSRALILEALSALSFDSDPSRVLELNWALLGKPHPIKKAADKQVTKAPVSMSYDMNCFNTLIDGLQSLTLTPRVIEDINLKIAPRRDASFSDHIRDIVIEAMLESGDFESGPGMSILRTINAHTSTLAGYMRLVNENISFFEKEIIKIESTTRASGEIQRIVMRFTSFLQELASMANEILMTLNIITSNIEKYFNEYSLALNMQKVNDEVMAIEHDVRNQVNLAAEFSKQNIDRFEDELTDIHKSPFMSQWLGAKLSRLGYKIVDSGSTIRVDTITRTGAIDKKTLPNRSPKIFSLNMVFTNAFENSLSVIDNMQKLMPKTAISGASTSDIYKQFSELKETTGLIEEEIESRLKKNKLTIDDIHNLRKENRNLIVVEHDSRATENGIVFNYYISDKFKNWLRTTGLDERSINKISDLVIDYILNERWSPNLSEVVLDVLVERILSPIVKQYFA